MLLTRGSSLYLKKMMRILIRLIISVLPIRVIAGGWCYVSKYRWVRAISKYLSQYLSSLLRRLYTFIQHWECPVLYFYRYVLFTARTFYYYPVVSKFVRQTLWKDSALFLCTSHILPCLQPGHFIVTMSLLCIPFVCCFIHNPTPSIPFYIEHMFLL